MPMVHNHKYTNTNRPSVCGTNQRAFRETNTRPLAGPLVRFAPLSTDSTRAERWFEGGGCRLHASRAAPLAASRLSLSSSPNPSSLRCATHALEVYLRTAQRQRGRAHCSGRSPPSLSVWFDEGGAALLENHQRFNVDGAVGRVVSGGQERLARHPRPEER